MSSPAEPGPGCCPRSPADQRAQLGEKGALAWTVAGCASSGAWEGLSEWLCAAFRGGGRIQARQGLLVPFSGLLVVPPAPPGPLTGMEHARPTFRSELSRSSQVQGNRPRPLSLRGLPATVSARRPRGKHTFLPNGLVESSLCACVWQSVGHLGVAPSLPHRTRENMALEDYTHSPPLSLGFRCLGVWFWTSLSPVSPLVQLP